MDSEDVSAVVRRIYEAAGNPDAWPLALSGVAGLIGVDKAMMFIADMPSHTVSTQVMVELDPDAVGRWQADYVPYDLWSISMAPLEAGFVRTGASVIDFDDFRKGPFYNDLIGPAGGKDVLTTSLAKDGPVHSAISLYGTDFFGRSQVQRLERIAPDLQLAVKLHRQIGALRWRAHAAEKVLDGLSMGVVTLDREGRVIRVNRAAESLLARRAGFTVRQGKLRCTHRNSEPGFAAAVARAAAGPNDASVLAGTALAIEREPLSRPLGVLVAPVLPQEAGQPLLPAELRNRVAVLVTISDPDAEVALPAERVARIFALTPAEARIAVALAAGATLDEYAEQAGVTLGTARWTVKRALEKTGCRRQSELVRLIATSVAGFDLGGVLPD